MLTRFFALFFTALQLGAGLAHLLALPNKIDLSADAYLVTQQVYRGWALLGIVLFGALLSNTLLVLQERQRKRPFGLELTAALAVAATLIVFFSFTQPANAATANWTTLPDNWRQLRAAWEYSHAANAGLELIAFGCLAFSSARHRSTPAARMVPSRP